MTDSGYKQQGTPEGDAGYQQQSTPYTESGYHHGPGYAGPPPGGMPPPDPWGMPPAYGAPPMGYHHYGHEQHGHQQHDHQQHGHHQHGHHQHGHHYGYHAGYYSPVDPAWHAYHPGAGPGPQAPVNNPGAREGLAASLGALADSSGLSAFKDLFNWEDGEFWKGAMVGAAVVILLTNESLRDSLLGGFSKTAEAMKSGLGGDSEAEREMAPEENPRNRKQQEEGES